MRFSLKSHGAGDGLACRIDEGLGLLVVEPGALEFLDRCRRIEVAHVPEHSAGMTFDNRAHVGVTYESSCQWARRNSSRYKP